LDLENRKRDEVEKRAIEWKCLGGIGTWLLD